MLDINSIFKNRREAFLEMQDLTPDSNVFSFALKMMKSLKNCTITNDDFQWIGHELQNYCRREKIATSNEICNLF